MLVGPMAEGNEQWGKAVGLDNRVQITQDKNPSIDHCSKHDDDRDLDPEEHRLWSWFPHGRGLIPYPLHTLFAFSPLLPELCPASP